MKTYFDIFSDTEITQKELLPRIGLSMECDVPDEIVSSLGCMLMGNSIQFSNLSVFRDSDTNSFYGIVFSKKESNAEQSKLVLSVAMLDNRLKNRELLGQLFQSMINDFCNSVHNKQTFIQWDEQVYPCNCSRVITPPADELALVLVK